MLKMKKGISGWGLIGALLLGLVFLYVFGTFFLRDLQEKLPTTASDQACRTTTELRGQYVIRINPTLILPIPDDYKAAKFPAPLACSTHNIQLLENIANKEKRKVKKDEIKEVFTKEIANCWYRFNEGRYAYILSKDYFFEFKNGDRCFPCALITVPDIEETISKNELEEHFITHGIKNEPNVKTEDSLYHYITAFQGRKGGFYAFNDIEPRSIYTIYYSDPWLENRQNNIYVIKGTTPPHTWKNNLDAFFSTLKSVATFGIIEDKTLRQCVPVYGIEGE